VKRPEEGVKQCGLAESVLGVDDGHIPLFIAAEDDFLTVMELTEVLESKFF
jgi:hypothetical protein